MHVILLRLKQGLVLMTHRKSATDHNHKQRHKSSLLMADSDTVESITFSYGP